MDEPSRRSSRRMLAGGALAALVLAAGGFTLGRVTSIDSPPVPAPSGPPLVKVDVPRPPIVEPVLGRAELIRAGAAAADAFAAGRPDGDVGALAGRRFELLLPFGCGGPPAADARLRWRYDEKAQALRLHAEPVQWPIEEWISPAARDGVEAIEGFWIERPWTSSDECPAPPPTPVPSPFPSPSSSPSAGDDADREVAEASAQPTLGIAQIFTSQGSRLARRGDQPYQAVPKRAPASLDLSRGLRLRLTGRISSAPGGGPILCRAGASATVPPRCLIVAELGQVAIENPVSEETLAQWDVSTQSRGGDAD